MPRLRPKAQLEALLIATGNPGKFTEYLDLLSGIPYRLASLREEGISLEPEETGASYEENARLKAEAYASTSGLLTLADDSGLEVAALGREPGPMSARYGGPGLSDVERVQLLLHDLAAVPERKRGARFVCVIAIVGPQGPPHLVRGECEGLIIRKPQGMSGFGYDPIFLLPELGKTLAELTQEQKNAVSHRARAAQQARAVLVDRLTSR